MTDTLTLAPTDAEIEAAYRKVWSTIPHAQRLSAFAHEIASTLAARWGAPAPASNEALTTALAACVHCRTGSSENVGLQWGCQTGVHCRTGSSENPAIAQRGALVVHCRTGSSEISEGSCL